VKKDTREGHQTQCNKRQKGSAKHALKSGHRNTVEQEADHNVKTYPSLLQTMHPRQQNRSFSRNINMSSSFE
jgi:hypothetical protein